MKKITRVLFLFIFAMFINSTNVKADMVQIDIDCTKEANVGENILCFFNVSSLSKYNINIDYDENNLKLITKNAYPATIENKKGKTNIKCLSECYEESLISDNSDTMIIVEYTVLSKPKGGIVNIKYDIDNAFTIDLSKNLYQVNVDYRRSSDIKIVSNKENEINNINNNTSETTDITETDFKYKNIILYSLLGLNTSLLIILVIKLSNKK